MRKKPTGKPKRRKCQSCGGALVWEAGFIPGEWTPMCGECGLYWPGKRQAAKASKAELN